MPKDYTTWLGVAVVVMFLGGAVSESIEKYQQAEIAKACVRSQGEWKYVEHQWRSGYECVRREQSP